MADLAAVAHFAAAFAAADVRLPLRLSDMDAGIILDADGRDVVAVDVWREHSDERATAIATLIVEAVNGVAAPAQPAGGVAPMPIDPRQISIFDLLAKA